MIKYFFNFNEKIKFLIKINISVGFLIRFYIEIMWLCISPITVISYLNFIYFIRRSKFNL